MFFYERLQEINLMKWPDSLVYKD